MLVWSQIQALGLAEYSEVSLGPTLLCSVSWRLLTGSG